MPAFQLSPGIEMNYRVDDYTDPWTEPETILMLHGTAESGPAWYGWVPTLARRFRVVRPDMRGFGDSTPMPRDFAWSLDLVLDDLLRLMDSLGAKRFHLVGAKLGGTIARALAGRHPGRVITLVAVGTPVPTRKPTPEVLAERLQFCEKGEFEKSARERMASRLGTAFPPEGVDWWTKFMARTPDSTHMGWIENISYSDVGADLPRIECPTLIIVTEKSDLGSVEATRAWQQKIPNSKLMVLPGNSYHVAASHADQCAQATLDFITGAAVH
jgi:pimeloyl-ACP methyl ester carboxylesterase